MDLSTNWPMVQMPLLVQGICTMRKTDTLLLPYNHTHTHTHTHTPGALQENEIVS